MFYAVIEKKPPNEDETQSKVIQFQIKKGGYKNIVGPTIAYPADSNEELKAVAIVMSKSDTLDEVEDKSNKLFVLDARGQVLKICQNEDLDIPKDSKNPQENLLPEYILEPGYDPFNLIKIGDFRDKLTQLEKQPFSRLCITEQCVTIDGVVYTRQS